MERKWVIIAVGDIRGFGAWTHRAAVTREIQEPFIASFYKAMEDYVRTHPAIHFKYLGDGFQIVREFENENHKDCIARFLRDLGYLLRCSIRTVKDCGSPAPTGFRLRIFSGFVYRLMVIDPNDPERLRLIPEFIDYAVNTAHRILQVAPEISCLCDGKIVRALGEKRSAFRVRKINKPETYPNGVDQEDVDGLCIIKL